MRISSGFRILGGLSVLLLLLVGGYVVIGSNGILEDQWFDGKTLDVSGRTADVTVVEDTVVVLTESGAPVVLLQEFSSDGKPLREAKVEVRLRHWRAKPKRPNLLMRNRGSFVFYGETAPGGQPSGLVVVDGTALQHAQAPIGSVEELAEGQDCIFGEVIDRSSADTRRVFCFSADTRSYEFLPQVDARQDVISLVPAHDGGVFALIESPRTVAWYRYGKGAWSNLGPSATFTQSVLPHWSGGKGTVGLTAGRVGDIRSVGSEKIVNGSGSTIPATFNTLKAIPNRIVFAELDGRLITVADDQRGSLQIADGRPPGLTP